MGDDEIFLGVNGEVAMPTIDRFQDAILTPADVSRYLRMPDSTLRSWLKERAAGEPLVHSVPPIRRGWPSLPFVAVVEAYVLRSLRDIGLRKAAIRAAASEIRTRFDTPYGLATRRIATDGIDVFVHYLEPDDLARAGDGQRPIREVVRHYLRYILWQPDDEFPYRLALRQYPDNARVVIDPQFGWGAPVVDGANVTVEAVVGLWRAGEPVETVARNYGLTGEQVESIVRVAA